MNSMEWEVPTVNVFINLKMKWRPFKINYCTIIPSRNSQTFYGELFDLFDSITQQLFKKLQRM